MKRILVVGAGGQIGTELVPFLQKHYGYDNVIAADLKPAVVERLSRTAIAMTLDALNEVEYADTVRRYRIDAIYNDDAYLSKVVASGRERARESAAATLSLVRKAVGFKSF